MVTLSLAIAVIALFISLVVALATAELARRVPAGQTRDPAHLEEFPLSEETVASKPSEHGLPAHLDAVRAEIVLFLSPMCKSCGELADELAVELPPGVTLVVTAASSSRLREWAEAKDIASGATFDDDGRIAKSIGISGSPAALGIADGLIIFGVYVAGVPALQSLVDQRRNFSEGYRATHVREIRK